MSENNNQNDWIQNSRVTWEGCSVLLDINDGDRLVFARLSAGAKLKIGNKNCSLQPLIGCPFGSVFRVETGTGGPYLSLYNPSVEGNNDKGECETKDESKDNRVLIDDNKAQSLTGEDIDSMRSQGATGDEIVEALIANSSTFETKTLFSQEKYRIKKQKKYAPKVLLRRPFARSICEAYFKKYPARIGFLRVDTLSLLLSMANVSANSDVLVVDMLGGLLTGAVAERLGGIGNVCNTYPGSTPNSMDIVRIFNFNNEICRSILRCSLDNLSSAQNGTLEQIADHEDSGNMKNNLQDQMEEITLAPEKGVSDLLPQATASAVIKSCRSLKAGEKAQPEAVKLWKESGFSSLIIAAPELNIWSLLKDLLPLLSNSAPFAIYHQFLQPLAICMHKLQVEKMAIGLQISEPWLREYQLRQKYEIYDPEAQTGGEAASNEHSKVVNDPVPEPEASERIEHDANFKVPKNPNYVTQISNAESLKGISPANNCRYDSSLRLLSKKFLCLIQEAEDGTLDLNHSAKLLQVQKRRIYDITNVLEGVGLIEKTSKNHIRWKGNNVTGNQEQDAQFARIKAEVEGLHAEEHKIEEIIREKQRLIRALGKDDSQKYLFLRVEDILTLPCFQNQTVIAIKAPQASYIEVPDPDEDAHFFGREYKMIVRSHTGPIDLYLLSKEQGQHEDVTFEQTNSVGPSASSSGYEGLSLDHQGNQRLSVENPSLVGKQSFGIQKIVPPAFKAEDDYWFTSAPEISITDLWGNEGGGMQADDLRHNSEKSRAAVSARNVNEKQEVDRFR
ncbi:hypothetical protein FNV43_RR11950 [Rhamnella rubrinervis]|uniref:tRNA (adenine(58)-N(1))-methyltransferase non-catalytic subunit TRM6 n=1 Tax=Rhamnella rubrinervis TaxID=2594499 RepID=A0A8K0H6S1_9ROSA|nr:hypothetical protein FNV43_RR11950 [Rhamnella rubrinervis]